MELWKRRALQSRAMESKIFSRVSEWLRKLDRYTVSCPFHGLRAGPFRLPTIIEYCSVYGEHASSWS